MAKKWHAMWIGSAGLFIGIALLLPLSMDVDRDGIALGATKLVYSEDLLFYSVDFYFDTTSIPHMIEVQTISNVANRDKPASISVVFPFKGELSENSQWNFEQTEDYTIITKEFSCSEQKVCSFSDSEQSFKLALPSKVDRKQSYSHSIEFSFDDGTPPPQVWAVLEPQRYETGFSDISSKATLLVDKSAERFSLFPQGEKPLARENQQIKWNIESGRIYSVDYEMPQERQIENNYGLILGLTGIAIGVFSLVLYSFEQAKKEDGRNK
ncbi:MAG: hypothetical protein OEW78_07245 [Nitrosopumilus sp.]|uniref:hypothetical protein n=1 Tax=Nitrosopumilus sp. TaxID=2024843 RepID=UPI00246DBCD7|nr:hypothetical protein [Nitrosopumilus sp.]MDH5431659.1 hypothetical protein [Nitrosopumilus sp.]